MLQSMRRHSQSFLIYVLFGMLIVVFVFMFGLPSTDSCDPQTQIIVAEAGNFEINDSDVKSGTMRTFGDTLRGGDKEFKAAQLLPSNLSKMPSSPMNAVLKEKSRS